MNVLLRQKNHKWLDVRGLEVSLLFILNEEQYRTLPHTKTLSISHKIMVVLTLLNLT